MLLKDTQAFQVVFWVQIPPLISPSCVILDALNSLYVPQFFHLAASIILLTHKGK